MVPDDDREPKAAVAVLACALGESESTETTPTVGGQSAAVLGDEIIKYVECHESSRLLRMHALRAGDGLTIARALGRVHRHYGGADDDTDNEAAEAAEVAAETAPAFSLDLYPSPEQRAIAGRFISEAREKRRSGAGVLATDDRWMLESISLPGGVALPRLRWARKEAGDPKTAAHLAVAFDTFESRVEIDSGVAPTVPFRAFGLLSFFERDFAAAPTPSWRSVVPRSGGGEKHPSERGHTERLDRLGQNIVDAVARHVAEGDGEATQRTGWRWPWVASNTTTGDADHGAPVLRTTILPEKADSIRELHRLCDWVVTLDRNAGIEYFDSPRDNRDIYDAYVIDCVPEREDLGCLQLITSTSNVEEVHDLLDDALVRMGLSRTRRNAEFLLEHLKSLSGRLAIRLTGNVAPTSELIALAIAHANCRRAAGDDACWTSLDRGFLVPVDDVRDLLPPLRDDGDNGVDGGDQQTRPGSDPRLDAAAPRACLPLHRSEAPPPSAPGARDGPAAPGAGTDGRPALALAGVVRPRERVLRVPGGAARQAGAGTALLRGQGAPARVADGTLPGDRRGTRSPGREGRGLRHSARTGRRPRLGVLSGVCRAGATERSHRRVGAHGSSCSVPVGCRTPISALGRAQRRRRQQQQQQEARSEPGRRGRTGAWRSCPPAACRRRSMGGTGLPSQPYRVPTEGARAPTEAVPARRRRIRTAVRKVRPAAMEARPAAMETRPADRRVPTALRGCRAARLPRTAARRLTSRRRCPPSRWAWTASPAPTCSGL